MPESFSVALTEDLHDQMSRQLLRSDGQEDLCFVLWRPSRGNSRTTALLSELILPIAGDRNVHGNASFMPQYLERAMTRARKVGTGLALVHSHLSPGWQDLSGPDYEAEKSNAGRVQAATDHPFVGLTIGTDGALSARFWARISPKNYEPQWCANVRIVGERLRVTYNDVIVPSPNPREALRRTVAAWGDRAQADLSRLHIGIVGAGSVGSVIGEILSRMGIGHLTLIDFDTVELINLDRLMHANRWDAVFKRAKVHCLARGIKTSSTAESFRVDAIEFGVTEPEGFNHALNCDVVFSCVDRPWARQVLNVLAYAHLIPIVDGGIRVELSKAGKFLDAFWRAHVASPGRRCLSCLGQFNSGDVSVERDGYFDDPSYIQGLPANHPVKRNENVFAFSAGAASLEVLQLLTMFLAPAGVSNLGAQLYHMKKGTADLDFQGCGPSCGYRELTSMGDCLETTVTGRHPRAEFARSERANHKPKALDRLRYFIYSLAMVFR